MFYAFHEPKCSQNSAGSHRGIIGQLDLSLLLRILLGGDPAHCHLVGALRELRLGLTPETAVCACPVQVMSSVTEEGGMAYIRTCRAGCAQHLIGLVAAQDYLDLSAHRLVCFHTTSTSNQIMHVDRTSIFTIMSRRK